MAETTKKNSSNAAKFILCSLLGFFMFFVSIPFNGKTTIPVDHVTTLLRNALGITVQGYIVLIVVAIGAILPFVQKTWNKSAKDLIFSIFKIIGLICAIMFLFHLGPEELLSNPDLLPYLFVTLCCSLCFLIPIGAVFLSFLTDYGLMEFVAVFLQPIMRKIWKTPGRSAIDAVASFVGSYSLALIITDDMYHKGRYTKKEAYIIATGFSTVSTTFMVVVAKTLDLMDHWNFYFWTTLLITFTVTAIVARIYPTAKVPDDYMEGVTPNPEANVAKDHLRIAWQEALEASGRSGNIGTNVLRNTKDGLRMISNILPTILSIGLLGMLLALYTPIFDIIGYIFYPFALLVRVPDALLAAQSLATTIAEMFLPAAFVTGAALATRYVVAVCCISELLFFSAVIPCILSTKIPVKVRDLIVIWIERLIFSILLAGIVALIVF
ncbi:YjiH family protein [Oscillibacter sp.]|uniref:YjiH family protein n=1 Tax=Oscillibacter sp. TaxID=1945593 RepID=UPI0028A93A35|nr:YjiH family protein [Oscillibacter sp.]